MATMGNYKVFRNYVILHVFNGQYDEQIFTLKKNMKKKKILDKLRCVVSYTSVFITS